MEFYTQGFARSVVIEAVAPCCPLWELQPPLDFEVMLEDSKVSQLSVHQDLWLPELYQVQPIRNSGSWQFHLVLEIIVAGHILVFQNMLASVTFSPGYADQHVFSDFLYLLLATGVSPEPALLPIDSNSV